KQGDGGLLAELLSRKEEREWLLRHEFLWNFLAAVVSGKVRLPPLRKLTWLGKDRRHWREEAGLRAVEARLGQRRDKNKRTYWTDQFCEVYDTTPERVAAHKQTSLRRRRP